MKPDCANCPYAENGKPLRPPTHASLPSATASPDAKARSVQTCKGVLVIDAPSATDVKYGQPLASSSTAGRGVKTILTEAGSDISKFAVLSAIACEPTSKSDSKLRQAVKCCAPKFDSEYAAVKHLPTLAMGKWAVGAVNRVRHGKFRPQTIKNGRGFLRDHNTLIHTWPPVYALFQNQWERGNFEVDVHRFVRMTKGILDLREPELKHDCLETLKALTKEKVVAVDIETRAETPNESWTGKDPTRARLRRIGIGSETLAVSIDANLFMGPGEFRDTFSKLVGGHSTLKILQNGWWFDVPVLNRYGFEVNNIADIRDMRRALYTTSLLSLRYMASIYCDIPNWKPEKDEDGK